MNKNHNATSSRLNHGQCAWRRVLLATIVASTTAVAGANPASAVGKVVFRKAGAEGAEELSKRVAARVVAEVGEQSAKGIAQKAAREVAEKATVETARGLAAEGGVRAVKLAAKREAIMAAKKEGEKSLVKTAVGNATKPTALLAVGIGTAATAGAHETADGIQEVNHAKADAIREVAKNCPGKLPGVLRNVGGGGLMVGVVCLATWLLSLKGLVLGIALYVFCAPFRKFCQKFWTRVRNTWRKGRAKNDGRAVREE